MIKDISTTPNIILTAEKICHRYGDKQILVDVNLSLKKGTISCLLGPSGSGKTTLLKCLAGLEEIDEGTIKLAGQVIARSHGQLPAHSRGIGVVFQDYALFPHMTVAQNIAFGLHHLKRQERPQRVDELLRLMQLLPWTDAYPSQLSGGQQQRVAIARALAPAPKLLLLDEPFSNLDPALREQLKLELKSLLQNAEVTALIVTHNQDEAFDMADEIGVMDQGRLLQWGRSYDLYHRPRTRTVAGFLGMGAFLPATIDSQGTIFSELGDLICTEEMLSRLFADQTQSSPRSVTLLLRPDDVVHDDQSNQRALVRRVAFRGMYVIYELSLPSGNTVYSFTSSHHEHHPIGSSIGIRLDVKHTVILEDEWSTVVGPSVSKVETLREHKPFFQDS
jgi:iron(III) transport system ATP-binding protein